jgi:hypothetical protein
MMDTCVPEEDPDRDESTPMPRLPPCMSTTDSMIGHRQSKGMWTTPWGPLVRYTVAFHVVGSDRDEFGGASGVDLHERVRIVTPLGRYAAVAQAALHFSARNPRSIFQEVDVTDVEYDFTVEPGDVWDDASISR